MQQDFGTINANGSINNAGSGSWTSKRSSAGKYTVTFKSNLDNTPVVLVSAFGDRTNNSVDNVFSVKKASTSEFQVYSMDSSSQGGVGEGSFQDAPFSFIVLSA